MNFFYLNTVFLILFNELIKAKKLSRNDIKNDEKTVDGGSN